ncbi:MAG: ParA family protein [bacterium]|nr:ParA family protein [bacterium]
MNYLFISKKGGVKKTTTTLSVATIKSAIHGQNNLAIDLDDIHSLTNRVKKQGTEFHNEGSTYHIIMNNGELEPQESSIFNLSLWPSVTALAEVERVLNRNEFDGDDTKFFRLKNKLDPIKDRFDNVFIDVAPDLESICTINGIVAADRIVILSGPSVDDTETLKEAVQKLNEYKQRFNLTFEILCILLTGTKFNKAYQTESDRAIERIKSDPELAQYLSEISIPDNSSVINAAGASRNLIQSYQGSSARQKYIDWTEKYIP